MTVLLWLASNPLRTPTHLAFPCSLASWSQPTPTQVRLLWTARPHRPGSLASLPCPAASAVRLLDELSAFLLPCWSLCFVPLTKAALMLRLSSSCA